SHTSGIQDFIVLPDFWELSADLERSRDELVAMFKNEPFIFEPGARWAYSNSNYTLLGLIIEAVSGQDYADFLEEAFFEPLGLASTRVCDTLPGEERAQGYYLEAGATLAAPAENMAWALGDGAICSSAVDLAAWKRALVTGRVVSHASYERMIAPETLQDGFAPAYGFGLSLVEFGGRPKVAHSGRMGGFSGAVAYYPDDDVIVAILSNLAGIEPETVERTVARAVLGLPEPEVRDLALSPGERQLYLGNFDTGVFPVTISEEGDRLYAEAIGLWPLLYQGDRTFTVEGEADTIRLSFGEEAQSLLLEFAGMHWYAERAP
ncbi:MAG: beta-lactamase family protein, partial [Deinococcota bacterium]|nr:beta-lactamase family protein [Deinococcota bacterium]